MMKNVFSFSPLSSNAQLEDNAKNVPYQLDLAGNQAVPHINNLLFFHEVDIYQGDKTQAKADALRLKHFDQMEAYGLFLKRKGRRPLFDLYPCFQPFNEATKAFFPFIKSLQQRLQPGDTILSLWDRSGYFAGLLAGLFSQQQVITTWTGNQDILGYKGFYHWMGHLPNLQVLFCDLDKPLPIQDDTISLVVGQDTFHRFGQSLLMRELLRITHDEAAIIFPHVHLTNSEPEPFFERGCKQLHGRDYDAFFQQMAQHIPRKGYVFGEPYLFWENDGKRNQAIPLVSTPDMTDYNALLAILPNSWQEPLAAFGMDDLDNVADCRVLVNQILQVDLHRQRVYIDRDKMEGGVGHLLDRHPIYVERLGAAADYPLSEAICRILHLAQKGLTIQEISHKVHIPLEAVIAGLRKLDQQGIVQVLPISEDAFRLQHFISTQQYLIPYQDQTLSALWHSAQQHFQDEVLLIDASDESTFTFGEADEVIQTICASLAGQALQKGDHVILYGELHVEALLMYWACMQMGLIAVPVPAHTSPSNLAHIFAVTAAKLICCDHSAVEMAREAIPDAPLIFWDEEDERSDTLYFSDWLENNHTEEFSPVDISHEDTAVVLFTSGSTSIPKGVPLTHGHLFRSGHLITETFHWTEKDKFLAFGGLGYMSGLRNSAIAPLISGTAIVVPDPAVATHAFGVAESIDQHQVSILAANPALYRQWVQHHQRVGKQLRSLKTIMCTGSQLTATLAKEFETAFQLPILNYYGLTETTGICTSEAPFAQRPPSQTIGKPVGCIAQVVDEMGNLVPIGAEGELRIFGENIMTGYLGQSALTTEVIRDGWFYTGDIASVDAAGYLQLHGRKREIVKTSTEELIYLSEIEAVAQMLPWVEAAAACAFTENDIEKIALFVLGSDEQADLSALQAHLLARLGARRLPHLTRIKTAFPYGTNGKILKKQLLHELQNG